MPHPTRRVFITGATGYLGRALSETLLTRGHVVSGLCREKSRDRLAPAVLPVLGDPLDAATYAVALRHDHVVVHLVGTPKPAPWKGASFARVDLGSVVELAKVVADHPVAHIVYVSVAHPAPIMRAYISARVRAEALLRATSIPLTVLRPWYVLGPGHWWPVVLTPLYRIADQVPALRDASRRLGLVTLPQMVSALTSAVEHADEQSRVFDVDQIRAAAQ